MDVLVALGTSAAYFYSVVEGVRTIMNPNYLPHLYFETSAVLITLILVGKLFEHMAKGRTTATIKELLNLQAKEATVLRNGEEIKIAIEEVQVGDHLIVKPAQAIVEYGEGNNKESTKVDEFNAIPGYGIEAAIEGKKIFVETRKLMKRENIHYDLYEGKVTQFEEDGKTAMFIAIDGHLAGIIAVADTVKESPKEAIQELQSLGIEVYMIAGDNERTANAIASQVGIKHVFAEVLPEDKAKKVKELQEQGKQVAMVGDGINDAPALALADIGIAIGTGTDVAIETADITLVGGDLKHLPQAVNLSRKTMKNIRQNLFWALAYNSAEISIAALVLLAPWVAGAAMAFSSVTVVSNALRLKRVKL
jgi:Cu+-exporting ATPase